jgi:phospholipase C
MPTRREFLERAAILAGAAGAASVLPLSIRRAAAIDPAPGSTFLDAEHVVILMQENRSFDHSYGSLQGVRGFNDPRAIKLPDGNPVWVQTDDKGRSYVPFRLNITDTNSTWTGCLPHGWTDQTAARNGGHHDRWLQYKRSGDDQYADLPLTLGHYTRDDIPFYYELADAFTICDQNFCSTLTGTTPNRLHLWTGTIRAQQSTDSLALVHNSDCEYGAEVAWPTFPELLEDAGVSWKIYQNELTVPSGLEGESDGWLSNFGDSPIEWFTQYKVRFAASRRKHMTDEAGRLTAEIEAVQRALEAPDLPPEEREKLEQLLGEKQSQLAGVERERHAYSDEAYAALSPRERGIHERAFCTNAGDAQYRGLAELVYDDNGVERRLRIPRGDVLYQFRHDVEHGQLPAVSWVVPPERFSDHPCSAWYGAWYIAEMLNILTKNPDVWRKTVFILTYDENDGYYDHVPPFVAPHPQRPETGRVSPSVDGSLEQVDRDERDSPMGLGYRVPLVIASPWSRGGQVCSQVFDHTSPIQFVEHWLSHRMGREVRFPQINSWRRTVCGDLTAAFRPHGDDSTVKLPFPERDEFLAGIHRAQFKDAPYGGEPLTEREIAQIRRDPDSSPRMPRQESGARPSCALPYELAADGALDADGRAFKLWFTAGNEAFGQRAAGAPLIVHARLGEANVSVRNYAVAAGERVDDVWSLADLAPGRYHLAVYGPNGFFREFQGDADDPRVSIELREERTGPGAGGLTGNVEILLTNLDPMRPCVAEVRDCSYGEGSQRVNLTLGATATTKINSRKAFGWYDLIVQIEGAPRFEKHYAGRVETGQPSYTDPAMGRVTV